MMKYSLKALSSDATVYKRAWHSHVSLNSENQRFEHYPTIKKFGIYPIYIHSGSGM